jgi:hypothetical protein
MKTAKFARHSAVSMPIDEYARLLCFVCEYLPKNELDKLYRVLPDEKHGAAGTDLKVWWTEHMELDIKRRKKNQKVS